MVNYVCIIYKLTTGRFDSIKVNQKYIKPMNTYREDLVDLVISGKKNLALSLEDGGLTRISVDKPTIVSGLNYMFCSKDDFDKIVTKARAKINETKKLSDNWIRYSILIGLFSPILFIILIRVFIQFSSLFFLIFVFFVGLLVFIIKKQQKIKVAKKNCQQIIDWSL